MKKNRIKDLDSLNKRISDLEDQESVLQQKLQTNWQYFKSDFGSILRTSILHKVDAEGRSSFLFWLFKIPSFNTTIGKAAEKLTLKLESLLVHWIDKITDKAP